jgi:hypothetical protein
MPKRREDPSWTRTSCLRIGEALLDAPARTATAAQISAAGAGSNIARLAARMVAAQLLEECPPPTLPAGAPGRRADKAFHLPQAQVSIVEAHLRSIGPGVMCDGHQLVFADATKLPDLCAVLEVSPALANASWFALCDGTPQEYAIAFSGNGAVNNSLDLLGELHGAGVHARRVAIAQIGTTDDLALQARRVAASARKARMRAASQTA